MNILRTPKAMADWSRRLHREGVTIGFVPTMGALHDGHRALIRAARLQCDALVVSIFVNPTQFAPTEDLAKYPRPIAKDRALCRAEGVDICFEPGATAIYPEGFETVVTVPGIAQRWEGDIRPHHFAGVATVVTKLFGMVRPDIAVFGQKDFQQAALVRRVIEDLSLGVKLIVHPTVREQDGLAMSSRNVYLSQTDRTLAPILYKSLQAGAAAIKNGTTASRQIQSMMTQVLRRESAATVDYLAVCDPDTLAPLASVSERAVLLGAIRIGNVRLIDNVLVKRPAKRGRR
ncbi:MAG: pantoate--beta-alanine ligase [Nitrospira sp.]|nr:pantoate--beta-alanine ligase [Nitrospira sp.]